VFAFKDTPFPPPLRSKGGFKTLPPKAKFLAVKLLSEGRWGRRFTLDLIGEGYGFGQRI
jgi:hypothetical protein|tara:strand:+ start:1352 stop:1528 length:177 start_codon:yes stop_codon:yes gene_type:complete